MEEVLAEIEPA